MANAFDYFVLFAEMRTGSNFLESNLNAIDGLRCHGEAFNPHFIGYPKQTELLGLTAAMRDADPDRLIAAIRDEAGVLGGFRYFHDHDPRVRDIVLNDPRCAKIVLTRNPLDSYVSRKIAQATGQWKLTDVKRRKDAKAQFDAVEFADHVETLQRFQIAVQTRLQVSGQTAFYIAYEDLQSVDVVNGLAQWLGASGRLKRLDQSLKPQNPGPVSDRVSNAGEMADALGGLDRFNLTRTPNFEPRRGAGIPTHVVGARTPLLYMPIPGGTEGVIRAWLADLDGVDESELETGLDQKRLRQWKRQHPGHRSFTVLRHPADRVHAVFCRHILGTGPGSFGQIRETLRRQFKLAIPDGEPDRSYSRQHHREAFAGFLEFVKANLAGQTAIRTDGSWASQCSILTGFADFVSPDFVLRERELPRLLPLVADIAGRAGAAPPAASEPDLPFALDDIHDAELETQIARIYQRDYMMFGFEPWSAGQAA